MKGNSFRVYIICDRLACITVERTVQLMKTADFVAVSKDPVLEGALLESSMLTGSNVDGAMRQVIDNYSTIRRTAGKPFPRTDLLRCISVEEGGKIVYLEECFQ